ncbi:hypothetical protein B0A48_10156 [Cryoendolithus antarcticus]|uniref:60S ribosomal protein L33-A n=1 Tax=Cryoendolithus antarcticus TaxID=1507870 RepID=A0A1V8SX63_9PEZI|nr:hypothetical protein B0A48_10156 [Cryoendolithus antarcticus]
MKAGTTPATIDNDRYLLYTTQSPRDTITMPSEQGHRLYVKYVHHTSANTPFNTAGNTPAPATITTSHRTKHTEHFHTNMNLFTRGKHLSYQRGKRNTNPNTSLIKIEGVDDPKAATFYNGKRIAYVYRGKKEIRGTKIRVIWGKVTRPHGNSGVVRAQFKHNLPPKSFGAMVRVMLYPSAI